MCLAVSQVGAGNMALSDGALGLFDILVDVYTVASRIAHWLDSSRLCKNSFSCFGNGISMRRPKVLSRCILSSVASSTGLSPADRKKNQPPRLCLYPAGFISGFKIQLLNASLTYIFLESKILATAVLLRTVLQHTVLVRLSPLAGPKVVIERDAVYPCWAIGRVEESCCIRFMRLEGMI